ncbi:outer membrane lipoprotein BfpB precursor [mine drainage metagenome]|uniref:Outer membrane lipoprotein BfpB n=1 Tax=mine drainage metagenome TaxID=410659 RepID=A0A1J5SPS8_9ZZZZ
MTTKLKQFSFTLLSLAAIVTMPGCATSYSEQKFAEQTTAVGGQRDHIHDETAKNRSTVLPYVGNRLITRKHDDENALPESLNAMITLGDTSPLTLSQIGQRLTALTKIPVNIAPELITNPAQTQTQAQTGVTGAAVSSAVVQGTTSSTPTINLPKISVAFTGSTTEFLNLVSSRLGITWEYADGSINFARYITRVYTLNIFPGKSTQNASVGKTGSTSGSSSSGSSASTGATPTGGGSFSSSSTSDFTAELDAWSTIDAQLKALVSAGGKYSASSSTGVIVVTDTKEAQSRIAKYIKKLDKLMNQQVTLQVSVISADVSENNSAGVNWTAVWNRMSLLSQNYSGTFKGIPLPSALTSGGGAVGVSFVTATGGTVGKWDGSNLMFQALVSEANASMVSNNTIMTLNKQPASVAIADQTGYAQSSTTIAGTAATPGTTSVTVGTLTTGFILNMTPSIMDDDEIALQFSLDISTPPVLTTISSIQIPSFSGTQIAQRAKIREGETLVLSGFSLKDVGSNRQGMFSPNTSMLLGGNRSSSNKTRDLVILITPVME